MVKSHNCIVKIDNGTKSNMTFVEDWYDRGQLADGFSWPKTIKPGRKPNVLNYETNWSPLGCSGYVTYNIFGTNITIAFSNPLVGFNKIGVGIGGKSVWDNMNDHNYKKFTFKMDSKDGEAILQFDCQCTGGEVNTCSVDVTAFTKNRSHPSTSDVHNFARTTKRKKRSKL